MATLALFQDHDGTTSAMHDLIDSTTRVALAAYLHDLGKFAERAGVFAKHPGLQAHLTTYCRFVEPGGYFSHQHAAHTALAFDVLEPYLPDVLRVDPAPFVGRIVAGDGAAKDPTDSLVNAAAMHHRPSTFLQWVIATADRVASGFERETFEKYNVSKDERNGLDHYTSRQLTLFEQLRLEGEPPSEAALGWRYPLKALAPQTIFPAPAAQCEKRDRDSAKREYAALWDQFTRKIAEIPASHRANLPLWMDHFDSLWLTFASAIPSATAFGVKPEVSLYDHSRAVAALAAALWRWHESAGQMDDGAARRLAEREDYTERKFLLVQGDFYGIQDFVFAAGGESRKQAAKLLRGRSFQVSLFTELAALRVLESAGLPPTSQIINAAGKFLIVAPNTPQTADALESARRRLDDWFLANTFGLAGLGLAWTTASCEDFLRKDDGAGFPRLMRRLVEMLEVEKLRRFDLCHRGGRVFSEAEFPLGPCGLNGRLPADKPKSDLGPASCALSRDQVAIGEAVIGLDRLLIVDEAAAGQLRRAARLRPLECAVFGYAVAFTSGEEATGRFGELASGRQLSRCWDFSSPSAADEEGTLPLWSGYARRFISGHVPRVGEGTDFDSGRYEGLRQEEFPRRGELKTFDMLACEDREPNAEGNGWQGVAALGILKGDIDNLGEIFRVGLRQPTFAKFAGLSRQVNAFFAIWLPWYLARRHPDVYTVFAGGDDFFLIGPWRTVQRLAGEMRSEFARYVAGNPGIHFSAGIATQKAGAPIHAIAALAEEALHAAKGADGKNALTCFGETVPWSRWDDLESAFHRLNDIRRDAKLSTAYVYGLLQFVEMRRREQAGEAPAAMWRSRMAYRTRRFVTDRMKGLSEDGRRRAFAQILGDLAERGIGGLGAAYRIVLFNHLYQFRNR